MLDRIPFACFLAESLRMSKGLAVNPPLLHVRTMMIVVTFAAVDLAAIRVVFGKAMTFGIGLHALIYALPMVLVLNCGLFCGLGTRGRPRAFWMGFLACGTAAMLSSAWGALTPAGSVHPANGAPNSILEGSRVWALWQSYFEFAVNGLLSCGVDMQSLSPRSLEHPGIDYITVVGLLALLPQLAIALVGGLVARSCVPRHLVPLGGPSLSGDDGLRGPAATAN
jgi:hypothetical protein